MNKIWTVALLAALSLAPAAFAEKVVEFKFNNSFTNTGSYSGNGAFEGSGAGYSADGAGLSGQAGDYALSTGAADGRGTFGGIGTQLDGDSISIAMWVKLPYVDDNGRNGVSGAFFCLDNGLWVRLNNPGWADGEIETGPGGFIVPTYHINATTNWQFLAFTYTSVGAGTSTLRFDQGNNVGNGTFTSQTLYNNLNTFAGSQYDFNIGYLQDWNNNHLPNALVDNVRVFNTALSSTELQDLRNVDLIPEPALIGVLALGGLLLRKRC